MLTVAFLTSNWDRKIIANQENGLGKGDWGRDHNKARVIGSGVEGEGHSTCNKAIQAEKHTKVQV